MQTNRSTTTLFAVLLLVTALFLLMNLAVNGAGLPDATWIIALITLAGGVGLMLWMWVLDRQSRQHAAPEVAESALVIPQAREWVLERPAAAGVLAAAQAADLPREAQEVIATGSPSEQGVIAPATEAMIDQAETSGQAAPAIADPLHPDMSPKVIEHQQQVAEQAEIFAQEQAEVVAHDTGDNYQPDKSTTASDVPVELAHKETQAGVDIEIPEKPAEPDLDREQVADAAAADPNAPVVNAALAGDLIAEKQVAEASAAAPVEPPSQAEAEAIVEQVTDEKMAVEMSNVTPSAGAETNAYVDPLEQIEGIGPVFRDVLIRMGVTTFQQLTAMSTEEITDVLRRGEVKRIPRSIETWAEQAAYLVRGDREGLTKFQETLSGGVRRDE